MAREILQAISKNDDERARFRARRKFQMDLQHSFLVAKDEGKAEGIEIGKAEGKKEQAIAIAKNSLKIGMSVADISKITGLTVEEIEALSKSATDESASPSP